MKACCAKGDRNSAATVTAHNIPGVGDSEAESYAAGERISDLRKIGFRRSSSILSVMEILQQLTECNPHDIIDCRRWPVQHLCLLLHVLTV